MKLKLKFNDSDKELLESVAAADVYEVALSLNEKMTEFANELDLKAEEAKAAELKASEIQKNHDSLAAELEKVKEELKQINEVRAAEKIQNDFNARMSDLNEKFELDEVKSKSIAAQIRGLDEETFASWLESFQPFLIAKKAPPFMKDDEEEEMDEKEEECAKKKSCASLIDEIKKLQPETKPVVNESSTNKSIDELMFEAFKGVGED